MLMARAPAVEMLMAGGMVMPVNMGAVLVLGEQKLIAQGEETSHGARQRG